MRTALPIMAAGMLIAGSLTLGPSAPAQQPFQAPDNVELIRNVEFGKGGERVLKLHILRPKVKPDKPMPALVYVFGGGWQRGDRDQGLRPLSRFAARGYFCVSIDYRLSSDAIFPAQIEDCKCAVRFLRAHAKEYNLDPERIGAWGGSAGGHLSALLGTSGGVKELEGKGGWPEFSSTVQAVCATAPPTDFVTWGDDVQPPVVKLLGGPVKDHKERAAQASPITYVHKGMPPFLLMHGDKDDKVPLTQSETLAAALKKAGADVALHVVKGHGHTPFNTPELNKIVDEFFDKNLKNGEKKADEPKAKEAPKPVAPEIVLKLRVHCLKSAVPEVNAEADEKAMKKMVEDINTIWAPAGIRFTLDKVTREDARDEETQRDYAKLCGQREVVGILARQLTRITPEIPVERGVFHIVFVHRFPANFGGRYFPELGLIVTPQIVTLRPPNAPPEKKDAVTERPLEPKVMAHELGHALSLMHVDKAENLMSVGPGQRDPKTWIKLTEDQIADARKLAADGKPFRGRTPAAPPKEPEDKKK